MITKQIAVNNSEKRLLKLCENSFLKLWTYPNLYKDDGFKEFCDLLVVFGNHVLIFFDRTNEFKLNIDENTAEKTILTHWHRWKREVVDKQIKTAHGAARYLGDGRKLFLGLKNTRPFPLKIDPDKMIVHKIIVAHGADKACKQYSKENIAGSLAIRYSDQQLHDDDFFQNIPFAIKLDKNNPVHVFDSYNLSILLQELDTISDFVDYLEKKTIALQKLKSLTYCGEEDLLTFYFKNMDEHEKHSILPQESCDSLFISEGGWSEWIKTDIYRKTKEENEISYFWDQLIQETCEHFINGRTTGDVNLYEDQQSVIYEMAKEDRLARRGYSKKMRDAINKFPDEIQQRQVTCFFSEDQQYAYVFLQLNLDPQVIKQSNYNEIKTRALETACGAAKNKFPQFKKIIGIAIEAPKHSKELYELFALLNCEKWSPQEEEYYRKLNQNWGFFETGLLETFNEKKFIS